MQEQTGLFAGQGGYQVNVGDHTQLDGAVIASAVNLAKNAFPKAGGIVNGNVDATGYVKSGEGKDVVSSQDIWAKRYIYESGLRVYSPNNKPTAGDVGGHENGNGISHTHTTLEAGQTVTLNSGRDTTLQGAQVSGEQLTADVKRHLTLSSEQDRQRYDSQQHKIVFPEIIV
ncbi:hypothetical protein F0L16_22125 [Photorhabdus heterorhabditis]|uniref:Uncharacterized protein n=1 Tax=Photorhabdus heterorhabditis TaxID=880156 RepID=A0A5B0VAE9_9GAMM|nr:hypothetical protein F0L16_22125 [Photorhabdus heterorhabditis]